MRAAARTVRLAVIALMLGAAAIPAGAADRTLRVDDEGHVVRIGAFDPGSNPRLSRAIRAFGAPDRRFNPHGIDNACRVVWNELGLTMVFSNFGGFPPGKTACNGPYGYAQKLVIRGSAGRSWRTWTGLRLGMTAASLRARHPAAVRRRHGYWLTTVMRPYGADCPCAAGGLKAWLHRGRVSSFRSWLGYAGD